MEEKGEEIEKTLFNLHLLQLNFSRHINDLRALKHLIKDAVAQWQATEGDHDKLKSELEKLANLQSEYETGINLFNTQFGWKQRENAAVVNKALHDNLNAARKLKVDVEILMRRVKKQLTSEQKKHEGEVDCKDEGSYEDEVVDDADGKEEEAGAQKSDELEGFPTNRNEAALGNQRAEDKSCKSMIFIVGGCISIVIVFYLCLGAVIKIVEDSKPETNEG